jgi:sec-independent protein translocase protein TatA
MPQLGTAEILVIFVVALLVFGPHKLPEIGRQVGRGLRELKKVQGAIKRELRDTLDITGGEFAASSSAPPTLPPKADGTTTVSAPADGTVSLVKGEPDGPGASDISAVSLDEVDPASGRRVGSSVRRSQSLTPVQRPSFDESPEADPATGRAARLSIEPRPAGPSDAGPEDVVPDGVGPPDAVPIEG